MCSVPSLRKLASQARMIRSGKSSQNLLVANTRLSLGKMTGKSFAYGPVTDVSLIARWDDASYADFRSRNYGLSLNFDVPGFVYFESGLLRRTTNYNDPNWLWRSYLISKPWDCGAAVQLHLAVINQRHGPQRHRVFHAAYSALACRQGRIVSVGRQGGDSPLRHWRRSLRAHLPQHHLQMVYVRVTSRR